MNVQHNPAMVAPAAPVAGWNFACPDWEQRLRAGKTPIADLPLDPVEAGMAADLFDLLRVPDIPGQPLMKDVAGEWFRDILRAAFGSVDRVSGVRQIGEIFLLVPKKNAKTTNAAAMGLVALLMNETPNIEGMILGPTQPIADRCFDQAVGMIQADPYLSKRLRIDFNQKKITDLHRDEKTGVLRNATLRVQSFTMKVATGAIPAFAIIDELHVLAGMADAARVLAQIKGGMITNPLSLLVMITTQSDVPPSGVFKDELQYARGVRDGRITREVRLLPVLYEFPEAVQTAPDKPWRNRDLWPMVLPNLNRSVKLPLLSAKYAEECEKGIEHEIRWASQHLNIEIGLGLHSDRWTGADFWQAAVQPGLGLEEILATSDVVTVGVDGGGLDDLFALALIGRHRDTRRWQVWARAWADPVVLVRRKSIAGRLMDFAADGDLVMGEGSLHEAQAADICERVFKAGLLPPENGIGLDIFGIAGLREALALRGVPDAVIVGIGQGWKLNQAVVGLPRKLKDRSMVHGGQPLLGWCVGNAKAELRGSNTVITKQAAGVAKIDPLIGVFNAAILMFANPVASRAASYEYSGM